MKRLFTALFLLIPYIMVYLILSYIWQFLPTYTLVLIVALGIMGVLSYILVFVIIVKERFEEEENENRL